MVDDSDHHRLADSTSNSGTTRRSLLRTAGAGVAALTVSGLASHSTAAAGASFGNGANLQPSYFCNGEQDLGWDLMDQHPAIQTLRIEIEPPSWGESQASLEEARRWIDEAAARGYEVIATCHHYPYNGESDNGNLYEAADWWVDNYDYLSANSSFTINLLNEWGGHDVSADQYATAYNEAVSRVRQVYGGSIVCDVPGWGQNVHVAADASPQLDDDDLILSAHVYPSAWNESAGEWLQPDHLDVLDDTGRPCMIGEFGANRDGDADWSAIVDHAIDLGWPVIAWAWNGDGEDDPMNMSDPYWGDQCSPGSYTESDYFYDVYPKLDADGSSGGGDDGSGDDGGGSGGDGSTYPEWDPNTVYTEGDRVSWNGGNWEAQWWTEGQEPRDEDWYVWQPV